MAQQDIWPDIELSYMAMDEWFRTTVLLSFEANLAGVLPDEMPDEKASLGDNGSLLLYVDVPVLGRRWLEVPKEHWRWKAVVCN